MRNVAYLNSHTSDDALEFGTTDICVVFDGARGHFCDILVVGARWRVAASELAGCHQLFHKGKQHPR